MRAVITAGGTVEERFADAIGTPIKALARVGTRALLDAAIDACTGAGIERIAVVGGDEVKAHLAGRAVRVIDAAADGATNVLRALDAWPEERFLYLTSDLPFVQAPGLSDFIARSEPFALTMALCASLAYDARFPGSPPNGLTLRGERIVNGCAFVLDPSAVAPARALATRFFDARKSLFALARLLGPALCLRFATKRLAVTDIERYASRVLGVPVAAIRGSDPGLCYDIDTLAEYEYGCTRLA
ncbi:MAG TPA: NTP transferase domain-containing protein [Candidatus Acidoferrum sp.]|jgi:GTP:adenosylcobinamide-phosphate guanylyltransferase|nr:NTP transferase domain-containing protein [Candidatus Acidoferrum sp.]